MLSPMMPPAPSVILSFPIWGGLPTVNDHDAAWSIVTVTWVPGGTLVEPQGSRSLIGCCTGAG